MTETKKGLWSPYFNISDDTWLTPREHAGTAQTQMEVPIEQAVRSKW
jgi:hypothetical protein